MGLSLGLEESPEKAWMEEGPGLKIAQTCLVYGWKAHGFNMNPMNGDNVVIQSVSFIIISCFLACSPDLVQVSAFSALLALVRHFISFLDIQYYPDKLFIS